MTRYIEADALLEELKLSSNMHAENSRELSLLHRDIVIVNEQPTADVAPIKHGKWISGNPICPCCGGDKFKDLDADIWADWQPKYCPNCGAKMDAEEKENG